MTASNPLPSWNNTPVRQTIIEYVHSVSDTTNPLYVPPQDRIATFDHDGTLWCEQPMYTEMAYLIECVQAQASQRLDWLEREPFKSVLTGNIANVVAGGGPALFQMAVEVMDGRQVEDYQAEVREWVTTSRHPEKRRPYFEMIYQPMRELITWLHQMEFKVFIVSGGTIDFVRPWSEQAYDIPPDRVVGSSIMTRFINPGEAPELVHQSQMHFIDDGVGKPVGIYQSIGKRPVLACGNSDGDLPMFEWTAGSSLPHHCILIHHTDGERECKYDSESPVGRLSNAMTAAKERNWTIVDISRDWKQVFADSPS